MSTKYPSSGRVSISLTFIACMLSASATLAQDADGDVRPAFEQPPLARVIQSSDAQETARIRLESRRQIVGDRLCLTYNRSRPGPQIHTTPGDTLRVDLANALVPFSVAELLQFQPPVLRSGERTEVKNFLAAQSAITNLHTHGLHVSPQGQSDNVLLHINPGKQGQYSLNLPWNHAPGTHWYHAHLHGSTALQVQGGMAGALIVQPPAGQDLKPEGFNYSESLLVLQVECTPIPSGRPAIPPKSLLSRVRTLPADTLPESLRRLARAESAGDLEGQIDAADERTQREFAEALGLLDVEPERFVVNQQLKPVAKVGGETVWYLRFVNAGSRRADYKELWLEAGDMYLAAFDGVNLRRLPKDGDGKFVAYNEANPLILTPGNRADVFVVTNAGVPPKPLIMRGIQTIPITDRTAIEQTFTQELMTFDVEAIPASDSDSDDASRGVSKKAFLTALDDNLLRLQGTDPYLTYLRPFTSPPAIQRNVIFSIKNQSDLGTRSFRINDRDYNEGMQGHTDYLGKRPGDGGVGPGGQTPWPPRVGDQESWLIENRSTTTHTFHIHVSPFWVHDIREERGGQIVSVRTVDPLDPRINRWQDTIDLPQGGSVVIWQRFSGFHGVFVTHCHLLQHEDRGMMMNIMLVPRNEKSPAKYFADEMKRNEELNEEING